MSFYLVFTVSSCMIKKIEWGIRYEIISVHPQHQHKALFYVCGALLPYLLLGVDFLATQYFNKVSLMCACTNIMSLNVVTGVNCFAHAFCFYLFNAYVLTLTSFVSD